MVRYQAALASPHETGDPKPDLAETRKDTELCVLSSVFLGLFEGNHPSGANQNTLKEVQLR